MFHDELVSSWIARNALTYGMKPSQLSTLIFGNTDLWKSDMDVYIRSDHIEKLSLKMNVDIRYIKVAPFFLNCDYFYSQSGNTTQVKWVMPIGIAAKRRRTGLQYCPRCLIEDEHTPYYRKHWRLGFITACIHHAIQLLDRCPNCNHPISLKRLQKAPEAIIYHPIDIVYCAKCNFDLRCAQSKSACVEEMKINQINSSQYANGYGSAGNQEFQYSNLYFEGIRRLLSFLICNPKGQKLCSYLKETIKPYHTYVNKPLVKHLEPELMAVEHRRLGFLMIYYFLQDWPNRFVDSCKASATTTTQLYSPYLSYPFWIADTIRFSLKTLPPIVAKQEKDAIKHYLSKKLDRSIKDYETAKFLKKWLVK